MTRITFADLAFMPHPTIGAFKPAYRARLEEFFGDQPEALEIIRNRNLERAVATFPNGRRLSVLRNHQLVGSKYGLATYDLDGEAEDEVLHETEQQVQAEMDRVAALPA